jgi:hypothetical protein
MNITALDVIQYHVTDVGEKCVSCPEPGRPAPVQIAGRNYCWMSAFDLAREFIFARPGSEESAL